MEPIAEAHPEGTVAQPSSGIAQCTPCAWSEVSHKGSIRLRRCGSKFFLQHLLTGEVAALPEGHVWDLHLSGEKMFASSPTHDSLWCTSLLRTSIWARHGRILIFGKAMLANKQDLSMWLDEAIQQRKAICINMEVPLGAGQVAYLSVKGYHLVLPRAGARIFVEVKKIAEFVATGVRDKSNWLRQGLRRSWIGVMASRFGVQVDHFIPGSSGVKGGVATSDIEVHNSSCSTSALLLLLCLWAKLFATKADRLNCILAIILALVKKLPQQCNISIEVEACDGSNAVREIQVALQGHTLGPCAELQPTMREFAHMWPFKPAPLHMLPRIISVEFDWVLAKIFVGVAAELDKHLLTLKPPEPTDLLCLCQNEGAGGVDPDLRHAVGKLGRNRYRLGAFAKTFNAKACAHDARVDHMEQSRYWLAARRVMANATTVAMTTDGTRFSKKDWNCGTVCNVTEQQFAWIQPVAIQIGKGPVPPNCSEAGPGRKFP